MFSLIWRFMCAQCFMEPLKKVQVEGHLMFAEPHELFGNLDELCYVCSNVSSFYNNSFFSICSLLVLRPCNRRAMYRRFGVLSSEAKEWDNERTENFLVYLSHLIRCLKLWRNAKMDCFFSVHYKTMCDTEWIRYAIRYITLIPFLSSATLKLLSCVKVDLTSRR